MLCHFINYVISVFELTIYFFSSDTGKRPLNTPKPKTSLWSRKMLGHKNIQNTLLYSQLISFESDEFHSATAATVREAQKPVEEGFE